MKFFEIFLSIVIVLRNESNNSKKMLSDISNSISPIVVDYEIIIIDNCSDDDTILKLKDLTSEDGIPNLQVFSLLKKVDQDSAVLVGLENSLGDYVVTFNPLEDDINFLSKMIQKSINGYDVVLAKNNTIDKQSFTYKILYKIFNYIYKISSGINFKKESCFYKILSKRIVNTILQDSQPNVAYRYFPIKSGFKKIILEYNFSKKKGVGGGAHYFKSINEAIKRGILLIFSTSSFPMRIASLLCALGAFINIIYSFYVFIIAIFKKEVAAGWISLSLQQSGMFFLLSIILYVMSEYILQIINLSKKNLSYYIKEEFNSVKISNRNKLNIK